MSAPTIKGWCPGAWRPMRSGDGLIVRVRPRLARLDRAQVLGLCDLAAQFGSGEVELTNRANLQIRGVGDAGHEPLLQGLAQLGLLDADPATESRRNILVAPFWQTGDLTGRLAEELMARLDDLPDLPGKFGFAVDAGTESWLARAPADIRLERCEDKLILRADGAATGRAVSADEAIDRLVDLARWFADATGTGEAAPTLPKITRMAQLLTRVPLPEVWTGHGAATGLGSPHRPGPTPLGPSVGLAFGRIDATVLAEIVTRSGALAVRVTPWRCLILEGGALVEDPAIITDPTDPLLTTDACPGAPFCASATVDTRSLARTLARSGRSLHVSGCAKGCARSRPADVTLVGRDGLFDLVLTGAPWEEPHARGLSPDDVIRKLT